MKLLFLVYFVDESFVAVGVEAAGAGVLSVLVSDLLSDFPSDFPSDFEAASPLGLGAGFAPEPFA